MLFARFLSQKGDPKGAVAAFSHGSVRKEGQFLTQKLDSLKILHPKTLVLCIPHTQNLVQTTKTNFDLSFKKGYFQKLAEKVQDFNPPRQSYAKFLILEIVELLHPISLPISRKCNQISHKYRETTLP